MDEIRRAALELIKEIIGEGTADYQVYWRTSIVGYGFDVCLRTDNSWSNNWAQSSKVYAVLGRCRFELDRIYVQTTNPVLRSCFDYCDPDFDRHIVLWYHQLLRNTQLHNPGKPWDTISQTPWVAPSGWGKW